MPARRRSARLGTLLASTLLLAGCGTTEPEPLEALPPVAPADLCATIPEAARTGLIANSNTDETGNPTAACSLRSADAADTEVRAVITWLQVNDELSADEVLRSQCAAIDRTELTVQQGFRVSGAEQACAGSGKVRGADSATMAAVSELEVVTVRVTSKPAGTPDATARAQEMLEAVLSSLAGTA
jgi:hypothetical protein